MICCEDCYPCCDYCIYVLQEIDVNNKKYINVRNIGCTSHDDQQHQELAKGSHYCRDFKCKFIDQKEKK